MQVVIQIAQLLTGDTMKERRNVLLVALVCLLVAGCGAQQAAQQTQQARDQCSVLTDDEFGVVQSFVGAAHDEGASKLASLALFLDRCSADTSPFPTEDNCAFCMTAIIDAEYGN